MNPMKNHILFILFLLSNMSFAIAQQTTRTITIEAELYDGIEKGPGPHYSPSELRLARWLFGGGSYYYRSVMLFNIEDIVNSYNVSIDEIKIKYHTSNDGNFKFYITYIESVPRRSNGEVIWEDLWEDIVDSDTLEADVAYKKITQSNYPSITSNSIKNQIASNLTNGQLILGFFSKSETNTAASTTIHAQLEITYTFDTYYDLTIRNNLGGQHGGLIGVGVGGPVTQRNSPYTFTTQNETLLNLTAYDNQISGGYTWVFNDIEAPNSRSNWQKTFADRPAVLLGIEQTFSITTNNDANATITNHQRRLHNVSRIDQTELGNITIGVVATVVQNNTDNITAPATKIVNGRTLYFTSWSDGVGSNPRTVEPTDHTTFTALFKGSQLATSVASNSKPNQQKIVQTANGWLHRTYERTGPDLSSFQWQLHPLPSTDDFNGFAADFRTESGYRLERVERVHHRLGKSDRTSIRQIQDPHQSG